jgi:hypothetical protein
MDQQCYYVGLDVSLETTSICVIDDAGAIIWRGKCSSDPDTITAMVRQHAPGAARVGLETGQLSNWLTLSLRRRGVPLSAWMPGTPKLRSAFRSTKPTRMTHSAWRR